MGDLRGTTSIAEAIGAEIESFLSGRYVEELHRLGRRAPVWAWLNEAAHATKHDLRATAAAYPPDDPDVEARTRGTLARALLGRGGDDGIERVQRALLVPLELAIMGQSMTPRRLVELVCRTLYFGEDAVTS
jgi:hypothetical protein